jgi:hypothetical protein
MRALHHRDASGLRSTGRAQLRGGIRDPPTDFVAPERYQLAAVAEQENILEPRRLFATNR